MTLARSRRASAPAAGARAVEVAEAAALATLVAAVSVVDRIVPLGFAGFLLGAFPLAVLGVRHRARVCAGGVVTATVLTFVGAGPGLASKAFAAAAVGAVVGVGLRRDWSTPVVALMATLFPTLPAALLGTGALAVLSRLRELVLTQTLDGARGTARVLGDLGVGEPFLRAVVETTAFGVRWWWAVIPAAAVVGGFATAALTTSLFRRPVEAVTDALPEVPHDLGALLGGRAAAPLPLRLRGVGVRRGGRRVLGGVDLDLEAGRVVTVTGPNGAGKSTLARVVSGLVPDEGEVDRPGGAGLGVAGGTAMVFQRPESQVLGVRVGDDVRWGATGPVDVPALLARVGLDGDADRETDTLSGGELQRLALASALARRPAVVVSDETTAMLDATGRDAVVALLGELAAAGTAVVHVTHRRAEIDAAEQRVALVAPAPDTDEQSGPGDLPAIPTPPARAGGTVVLRGVAVTHDAGSPWRRDVLAGVDLVVPAGRTLLLTGPNGAGKTTLAWVLAGLAAPSRGEVLLDGAPLANGRDGALLGVQHARLGLLRTTVDQDVRDAGGIDAAGADAALAAVGLDPDRFRDRAVDGLSGGEARRALLAGLLATDARVLVLDEPLAGLDAAAVTAVVEALAAVRAAGTTLVVTTHDVGPLAGLADLTVTVADGTVGAPAPGAAATPLAVSPAPAPAARARAGVPRRRPVRRVGRTLPGTSPATRVRAGTKVAVLVALVLALAIVPAWATVVAGVAVLAGWAWLGRVPPAAWPRPPLVLVVVAVAVLAVVALGGAPDTAVAGVPVSLAALERSGRLLVAAVVTLAGSILLVATTPIGTLPPLVRDLAARLRWTRLPVDEWALTVALGLRLAPPSPSRPAPCAWCSGSAVGPARPCAGGCGSAGGPRTRPSSAWRGSSARRHCAAPRRPPTRWSPAGAWRACPATPTAPEPGGSTSSSPPGRSSCSSPAPRSACCSAGERTTGTPSRQLRHAIGRAR